MSPFTAWVRVGVITALLAGCGSKESKSADSREVAVLVSAAGYAPEKVDAKPGEALDLVFTREDENNCGDELVLPATGEKFELPVGKPVHVAVTAPASGELAFTCGMAMYKGAVVVSAAK